MGPAPEVQLERQAKYGAEDLAQDYLPQTMQSTDDGEDYRGNSRSDLLPQISQGSGGRRLERTCVPRTAGNDDAEVEQDPESSEGDDDASNRSVDGRHLPTKPTSEEKKGELEHHWQTLNKCVERPPLQSLQFPLTVSTTFDHRPSRVS